MQILVEALGWTGVILLVVSLTQSRVRHLPWMNLAGPHADGDRHARDLETAA